MTAGSPRAHHTGDPGRLERIQADRIAGLFAQGMPAGQIAFVARCTRARVHHIAQQRGWQLDAAGVLPREQRPAVTPGKPVPTRPAGLMPARPQPPHPRRATR